MKIFLWRPTWAHFHLELLWQFTIEDRIWFETLNYPVFDPPKTRSRERQTVKKHFSLEENPLKWWARRVFSFLFSDLQLFFFLRHRSGASEAGIRILNVLLFGNIWNSIKNSTKYSSSKIIKKITQKFPADFIFIPGHWINGVRKAVGNRFRIRWNWNLRQTGNSLSLVFASMNYKNVQWSGQFFHSIFWLEVSRDFGQFLRRLRKNLRVKFEGSLKVAGILRSFIAAVWRDPKLVETQKEQRAPRISATFENQQKVSWTSLVIQFLKIGPSSRVGLAETVQSTHWKKKIPNPRNDSSIFHSTSVQEQSNPTKSSTTHSKIKCFSQKTLDSILKKIYSKLACFSEISAEKKLDSPGWLKGW